MIRRRPAAFLLATAFLAAGVVRAELPEPSQGGASIEALTQAIASFADRHRRDGRAASPEALERIVALASQRRDSLLELAESDPAGALRVALPESVRGKAPAAVRGLLEQRVALEGELEAVYEDAPGLGEGRYRHFLKVGGERFALHFPDDQNTTLPAGRARVEGLLLPPGDEGQDGGVLIAYCCGGGGVEPSDPVFTPEPEHTTGEQRTLVLLVNFLDTADQQPYTRQEAADVVFGKVSDYLHEASYGQTWLAGDVRGWFTLPIDSTCNTIDIGAAADAAAVAAGIDMSRYGRFIYFQRDAAGCFWTGASTLKLYPSRAWARGLGANTTAHELGHGLGLRHAYFLDCQDGTLGADCRIARDDKFDVMGETLANIGHYNGFQKHWLGWLAPGEIVTVTADGTYELQPFEEAGGTGPKVLRILKETDAASGGATWYHLEYRQAIGFDGFIAGNENVLNGVLVRTGADFDGNTSTLLDMTPESEFFESRDRLDPALAVGARFSDPASGVTLETLWADGRSAGVSVRLDGGSGETCVHADPGVSISPAEAEWAEPGTPVSFQVSVANADAALCGASQFALEASVPAGWSARLDPSSLSLDPGRSGSLTLEVTSPSSASDGFYDVGVLAWNASSPANTGSASATYVVQADSGGSGGPGDPPGGSGNSDPVAEDDKGQTRLDRSVMIPVLVNDYDADGDPLTVTSISQPKGGSVAINPDGSVSYTPHPGFRGTDRFDYTISDGQASASASVSVGVKWGKGAGR